MMRHTTLRAAKRCPKRRGATLVEAAITLPVFLLLVFGLIDLGFAVQRANLCAEAARIGARMVVVHGSDSLVVNEAGDVVWEPWTKDTAESGIRTRIEPLMIAAAVNPDQLDVTVIYEQTEDDPPMDDNAVGREVVVRVTVYYEHLVPFLGLQPLTVGSESRMIISN